VTLQLITISAGMQRVLTIAKAVAVFFIDTYLRSGLPNQLCWVRVRYYENAKDKEKPG